MAAKYAKRPLGRGGFRFPPLPKNLLPLKRPDTGGLRPPYWMYPPGIARPQIYDQPAQLPRTRRVKVRATQKSGMSGQSAAAEQVQTCIAQNGAPDFGTYVIRCVPRKWGSGGQDNAARALLSNPRPVFGFFCLATKETRPTGRNTPYLTYKNSLPDPREAVKLLIRSLLPQKEHFLPDSHAQSKP